MAHGPTFLSQDCSNNGTTANGTFQLNLRTLFSSLSSKATANSEFHNTTVTGRDPSDNTECSFSKQAVIWYDECMVRYSNRSFFSTVDTIPSVGLHNTANISNQASFMRLLFDTINQTAGKTAIGAKKYTINQINMSGVRSDKVVWWQKEVVLGLE
ncbi:hypothetical protein Fmac_023399 [Flemingia macrophylla]|uniref:Gnk2-homologous domain-containing protein n=1 Tax=Flemingia macrophylla TaxID=520843 RepID=A0ABD1LLD7_9FABA